MNSELLTGGLAILTLVIGIVAGYFVFKSNYEKKVVAARESAEMILEDAKKDADRLKKEVLLEAKEENHKYRTEVENELKERRNEVLLQEKRMIQREQNLDRKDEVLEKREQSIEDKENKLQERVQVMTEKEEQIDSVLSEQKAELERISTISREEAQQIIMQETREELSHERAVMVKESEQRAKDESDRAAKSIILQAIQRSAADLVAENTVTVMTLPNDEMKGRIIGREGRNIRTLETLTGVDLIIDDTPEAVILSGYDPIRREIAKTAIKSLIDDGRIHPSKIEEAVDKARKNIDQVIRDAGEQATFDLGIHNMHPDLVKIVGKLKYRTSYGQNGLQHSMEVAYIAGLIAAELDLDVATARRAGLLHDIGKALDHEVEGSHVEIGVALALKYKENAIVVNAIASHHGDTEPTNPISVIVATADALSASRPGARRESLENYIKRLQKLEEIANEHKGVEKTFAIQAGREIRVIVNPEEVDDTKTYKIAKEVKNKIEETMQYPGNIKVNVIREVRAVKLAR